MNILGTQYTLKTKAYEIYLSGCKRNPHCTDCHNPSAWDFNAGEKLTVDKFSQIATEINNNGSLVQNVWILGGEPLDQPYDEFYHLVEMIHQMTKKNIWVFTGYDVLDALAKLNESGAIFFVDYLKYGSYDPNLTVDNHIEHGVKLATSNQHILTKIEMFDTFFENDFRLGDTFYTPDEWAEISKMYKNHKDKQE